MKRNRSSILIGLAAAVLVVGGCQSPAAAAKEAAIKVEKLDSGLSRLTLSTHAAARLDVTTAEVRQDGSRWVIPYGAVIYDAKGLTWAYTVVEPLTFERAPIAIERITDSDAILTEGPPAGTLVVSVGAEELYGAETGVGGGH